MYKKNKSLIVKILPNLFYYSGLTELFYFLNRNSKLILSYHNIIPEDLFTPNLINGVSHSDSVFDAHLRYIASKFKTGTDIDNKHELIIAFDDGYLNQYSIAHPLLKKYNLKAFFFITLDLLPENAEALMIDRFLFWLSYVPAGNYKVPVSDDIAPIIINITGDSDRLSGWQQVYSLIKNDYYVAAPLILKALDEVFPFAEIEKRIAPTYIKLRLTPMPKNAIEELKAYGHKIGAHAKTHGPLTGLSNQALEDEIRSCADKVGNVFNTTVFSYPFGGLLEVTEREINCVKKHGFTHAVTNINNPTPSIQHADPYFIPRMSLPNTSNTAEIAFYLSGAKYFLQHCKLLHTAKYK